MSNVLIFKYKLLFNNGEHSYILPTKDDFEIGYKDILGRTFFNPNGDYLKELIKDKLEKKNSGGSRNMRKTIKNNKIIKNKTLRTNRI